MTHSILGVIVVDAPEFNEENRLAIFDNLIDERLKRYERKNRELSKEKELAEKALQLQKENDDYNSALLPPLTKHQCAVISTYTGVLLGKFEWTHEYIEKIMGRPVFTHELGDKAFYETIKAKAKGDFLAIHELAVGYNAPLGK